MLKNLKVQRLLGFANPIAISILVACNTLLGVAFAAESSEESKRSAKTSGAFNKQGFSSAGLQRIDAFFADEMAKKRVPGAVVGIMRHGQVVYLKAFGLQNPETGEPMRTDSIFAVASMTKPMVAVGALTLTQQGKLPLFSKIGRAHV